MKSRLLALAAWFACATAAAGSFSITPVRIDIVAGRRAASLEIENTGGQTAQVQAERYRWKRDNGGDDELEPTEEFVVSPPIFALSPGQKQIVRVLLLAAADPAIESAYRLILQEVPQGDPPPNTIATVLRISLPVFVTPTGAAPDIIWSVQRDGDALRLTAENRGRAHAFISAVHTIGGEILKVGGYLLAGERRQWPLDAPLDRIVVALRDRAESTIPLSVSPPPAR